MQPVPPELLEPAQRVADQPLSLEDFLALPEDNRPIEVVDGQLVMSPSPAIQHQIAVAELTGILRDACPSGYRAVVSPLDWVLWQVPRLQVRQPDVMVVTDEQLESPRLMSAPALAVEILSPVSFERDVITKRREYARARLQHYWVVDLHQPEIVVFALRAGVLVEAQRASGGDRLRVSDPFPIELAAADLV